MSFVEEFDRQLARVDSSIGDYKALKVKQSFCKVAAPVLLILAIALPDNSPTWRKLNWTIGVSGIAAVGYGLFISSKLFPLEPLKAIAKQIANRHVEQMADSFLIAQNQQYAAMMLGGSQQYAPPPAMPSGQQYYEPEPEYQEVEPEYIEEQSQSETKDPIGLISALRDLGVNSKWVDAVNGASFTRCLVELVNNGAKVQKIKSVMSLDEDVAAKLGLEFTPFISRDKGCVAIDIPRPDRQIVPFSDYIEPCKFPASELKIAIGVDLHGKLVEANLGDTNTCHILVGGTTGSGKSALLRAIAASIFWRYSPDDAKVILVDPKQVEFNQFEGLPWLLKPPVYSEEDCIEVMEMLVDEMETRYTTFRKEKVSNIADYLAIGGKMARYITFFDEFADFMVDPKTKKELEVSIKRLGAKARASGINLIIGTQRPSGDVVTPLIRSNLPARICLMVASEADSKIVLGGENTQGKNLLGKGDLLFMPSGGNFTRLQSLFVTDWGWLNQFQKGSDWAGKNIGKDEVREAGNDQVRGTGNTGKTRITNSSSLKGWEDPQTLEEAAYLYRSGEQSETWVVKNILKAVGDNFKKGQQSFREYLSTGGQEEERSGNVSVNPEDKLKKLEELLEGGVTDVNRQIDSLWPRLPEAERGNAIAIIEEMSWRIQEKMARRVIESLPQLEWKNRKNLPIDPGLFIVVNDKDEVLCVTCDESGLDSIESKIIGEAWICYLPIQDVENLQNYAMLYGKLLNARWNNENN